MSISINQEDTSWFGKKIQLNADLTYDPNQSPLPTGSLGNVYGLDETNETCRVMFDDLGRDLYPVPVTQLDWAPEQ